MENFFGKLDKNEHKGIKKDTIDRRLNSKNTDKQKDNFIEGQKSKIIILKYN